MIERKSMQQEVKERFEREGERAFGKGLINPYLENTAAWAWWNNGNRKARDYYLNWIEQNTETGSSA